MFTLYNTHESHARTCNIMQCYTTTAVCFSTDEGTEILYILKYYILNIKHSQMRFSDQCHPKAIGSADGTLCAEETIRPTSHAPWLC